MLKWLIRWRISAFEADLGYDASYLRDLLDRDVGAFLRFARVSGLSDYRKDVPAAACYAAKITGALREDCGPCTQLLVTMALRDGVAEETLRAVLTGDEQRMGEDARLGFAFARATLDHAPEADALRHEVERRWGPRAIISLAFAVVSSRRFHTRKYELGHGRACQRVLVSNEPVQVARLSA